MRGLRYIIFFLLIINVVYAANNPAAEFCKEQGNTYTQELDNQGNELGICIKNGKKIDEWQNFKNSQVSKLKIKKPKIKSNSSINNSEVIFSSSASYLTTTTILSTQASYASFDWRNKSGQNWLTSVKDQGLCGGCWAFASVAAIESKINIQLNNSDYNVDLSEQDLISCSGAGNCDGGYLHQALGYIKNNSVSKEYFFGYTATDNICSNKSSDWLNSSVSINYGQVLNNADSIKNAIANYGPVTAFMVVCSNFYAYNGIPYHHEGDIFYDDSCWSGDEPIDPYTNFNGHSIILVGYDDAEQYWVAKNSWGASWGDSGYFKIAYNQSVYNSSKWHYDIAYGTGDNRVLVLDTGYVYSVISTFSDRDTIKDSLDNCPLVTNENQTNQDNDTYGDLCDNCINITNQDQANFDNDSLGDACDSDDDNDGINDTLDLCPFEFGLNTSYGCNDTQPPRILNVTLSRTIIRNNDSINLSFRVVDNLNVSIVKVNNILFNITNQTYFIELQPNETIIIQATDLYNNTNLTIINITFDNNPPTINEILVEPKITRLNETISVTINATDLTNIIISNFTKINNLFQANITSINTTHNITICDELFNCINQTLNYTLDYFPPTIHTINLSKNLTLPKVLIKINLNATDNLSGFSYYTPTQITTNELAGTFTINITVYDNLNNSITTQINYTVIDETNIILNTTNSTINFTNTTFEDYIPKIEGVNSTNLSIQIKINKLPNNRTLPSKTKSPLIYLNITANGTNASKVYFNLNNSNPSRIKVWIDHTSSNNFEGPFNTYYLNNNSYYFLTNGFSEFIIGEQYAQCFEGIISATCECQGNIYSSGYCCSNIYKTSSCTTSSSSSSSSKSSSSSSTPTTVTIQNIEEGVTKTLYFVKENEEKELQLNIDNFTVQKIIVNAKENVSKFQIEFKKISEYKFKITSDYKINNITLILKFNEKINKTLNNYNLTFIKKEDKEFYYEVIINELGTFELKDPIIKEVPKLVVKTNATNATQTTVLTKSVETLKPPEPKKSNFWIGFTIISLIGLSAIVYLLYKR